MTIKTTKIQINLKSIPFMPRTTNGYSPEIEKLILNEWKSMKAGKENGFRSIPELMVDLNG
jgi:hypothetical protein